MRLTIKGGLQSSKYGIQVESDWKLFWVWYWAGRLARILWG